MAKRARKTKVGRRPARAPAVPMAIRWTKATRETFLAALAETANVAAAARMADVPVRSPYQLKAADAAFSDAWDQAVQEGYHRLELMLLRRATYGDACDGEDMPNVSTTLALGILRHHKTVAKRGVPNVPMAVQGGDLRDRLEAKLNELNRRLGSDGA